MQNNLLFLYIYYPTWGQGRRNNEKWSWQRRKMTLLVSGIRLGILHRLLSCLSFSPAAFYWRYSKERFICVVVLSHNQSNLDFGEVPNRTWILLLLSVICFTIHSWRLNNVTGARLWSDLMSRQLSFRTSSISLGSELRRPNPHLFLSSHEFSLSTKLPVSWCNWSVWYHFVFWGRQQDLCMLFDGLLCIWLAVPWHINLLFDSKQSTNWQWRSFSTDSTSSSCNWLCVVESLLLGSVLVTSQETPASLASCFDCRFFYSSYSSYLKWYPKRSCLHHHHHALFGRFGSPYSRWPHWSFLWNEGT